MDGAVRITVEEAPHAIFQLADVLRSSGDEYPGAFLVVEVCPSFDGVVEVLVQASRSGVRQRCSPPGP